MTCQECELMVAEGRTAEVAEHLAECAECRALDEDLRSNTEAFASMREEVVPAGPLVIRRRARWQWAVAAAAAALMLGIALTRTSSRLPEAKTAPKPDVAALTPTPMNRDREGADKLPKAVPARAKRSPQTRVQPAKPTTAAEPMLVKMLTSDPDVVIYWLVEAGE